MIPWLDNASNLFSDVLVEAGYLLKAERYLLANSVEKMKSDMQRNRVDIQNLTIEGLGLYASPDAALKLSSLHNSKGREFDAVAMIDVHEGRIPNFRARTTEEIAEAKRLFYV
ncbi:MAG: ATP-dependent helicase [Desulfobulbaceae bacterium]|nr:MAG: ATP-dependent helicase [Desulfobulbaceae bacterium]